MENGNEIRSVECIQKAYVRFFNKTEYPVELIWINYMGEYKKYRILSTDEYLDINTYKTHPWIALNHFTKERLHVDKCFVYQPRTSREILEEKHPDLPYESNYEIRVKSYITIPLYSLRYRTLLEIVKYLTEPNEVDELGLPEELAKDLKLAVKLRNNLRQVQVIS